MDQNLNEIFTLPIGLKKVLTVDGEKLYTSDSLKSKLIIAINNNIVTKNISDPVIKLINEEKIIPCYMNKNLFNLLIFRRYGSSSNNSFVKGFYTQKTHKIYLIMENNMTWGHASDRILGELVIHELMHYKAKELKGKFFKIFENDLTDYYSGVFISLFELPNNITPKTKKGSFAYLKKMAGVEIGGKLHLSAKDFEPFYSQSSLSEKEIKSRINTYVEAIISYWIKGLEDFQNRYHEFYPATKALHDGYKRIVKGGLSFSNVYIQEALIPSEVIAMMSEVDYDNPSIIKVVKS